ncbi:hypothetical protein BOV89_09330 [Solemya velum gill symbiont]|nr:hypothetical protein BOV89_09330 [Solemya velum gill symbiont]
MLNCDGEVFKVGNRVNRVNWTDEYSVGVSKLDEQHQMIVTMINKLSANHEDGHQYEPDQEILSKMVEYAELHLKYEEMLMKKHGYPDFDQHKESHGDFIIALEHFSKDVVSGNKYKLSPLILEFLVDWWTNHILEEDMKFKPFFQEKGIS